VTLQAQVSSSRPVICATATEAAPSVAVFDGWVSRTQVRCRKRLCRPIETKCRDAPLERRVR
jgi:succinylarginine dihydrolase